MAQPLTALLEDLKDQTMTNCTFVFPEDNNITLAAHKNVLGAVSPVFKSMFFGPMAENSDGAIKITDIPYQSFQKLIWIIYGKQIIVQNGDDAYHLYNSSEKYNIPAVRKVARDYMLRTKNTTNASLYYKAGSLFRDDELKSACTELFISEIYNVTKKPKFFETTSTIESSGLNIKEIEVHHVVEQFKEELELEEHLKDRICKTLSLIRLLTTVTGQLFESIIPQKIARFECSLNLSLQNDEFGKLNKMVTPVISCSSCRRGLKFFSEAQFPKRCICSRNPLPEQFGGNSYLQNCRNDYREMFQMIEKYKTHDISKYSLEDVKILLEKFKNQLQM